MNPFHVDVVQRRQSLAKKNYLMDILHSHISNYTIIIPGTCLTSDDYKDNEELHKHVESITFSDTEHNTEFAPTECDFVYNIHTLDYGSVEFDSINDPSGEDTNVADVWALPSAEFHGLWESLVFDSTLKHDLLRFVETAMKFSKCGVDSNAISWNRVVLLHGPPGTGKTSLCRALSHKLAVRLLDHYPRARLLEVNSHGLFSKWFSESGKLIARLFERVREIAGDPQLLACILVDEVESLAAARRSAISGVEPSDAVRAVNALLTQLDRLRRYPNVLLLTTSNVTGALDVAFVDRADLKRKVGLPSKRAVYQILQGCCEELMKCGLVSPKEELFTYQRLESIKFIETDLSNLSLALWKVSVASAQAGLSARTLRRLPFLAHALQISPGTIPTLSVFIDSLMLALENNVSEIQQLFSEDEVSVQSKETQ